MDLTRVLDSPHALHAASAHLPISLGLLGLPLILFAVASPKRWPKARIFAGAYFFFAGLIALAAVIAGERAASELIALANEDIEKVVASHRQLGTSTVGASFIISVLLIASHFGGRFFGERFVGEVLAGLATVNAFGLAALVLFAGSSGGRLVYGFGIGTPIAGADGVSGATPVVGAYTGGPTASSPPPAIAMEESVDATYTPNTLPIDPAQAASLTYQSDIVPLLERHCFKCHRGDDAEAGLDLSTHAEILQGGDYAGPAVIPGAPDNSPVVLHIRGIYLPKMPKDADELTESELHTLRMWIAAGAKGE